MSKNPTRQRKNTEEPVAPGTPTKPSLDESISELTVKAKKGVERHWKLLVILIVGALAVVGVMEVVSALHESRETGHHATIFSVTGALSEDQDPDIDAMSAALSEVEGSDSEKSAYRTIVSYLIARADRPTPAGEDEDEADTAKKNGWRSAAAEFATQAAKRFPDDEEIQGWATAVQARVASEKDSSWIPAKRSYSLKPPKTEGS